MTMGSPSIAGVCLLSAAADERKRCRGPEGALERRARRLPRPDTEGDGENGEEERRLVVKRHSDRRVEDDGAERAVEGCQSSTCSAESQENVDNRARTTR